MTTWRRQQPLVVVLASLLIVGAATALVRASAIGARLVALGAPDAPDFRSRAGDADAFVGSADLVLGLTVLLIAPCLIAWCWRAAKNQQALGRRPERLGSGWAIGGWFVPLANFVIPVLVVQDLWRGSDVAIERDDPRWRIADRSWLVGWWWGLLVVAVVGISGERADQPGVRISVLEQRNVLALLGSLAAAAAAILAASVVRMVTRRQDDCRRVQANAT